MTTLLSRPLGGQSATSRPVGGRLFAAAAAAAAGAALRSLVGVSAVVLLVWAAEDRARGGAVAAQRVAVEVWLVAHGAHVSIAGGRWGLLPLGLVGLPLWLCRRAGTGVAARSPASRPAAVAVALALPYAALALVAAALAGGPAAASLSAALGPAAVAAVGALWGAGVVVPRTLVPDVVRPLAAAGAAATGTVLAAAALLSAGSMVAHGGLAVRLASAAEPGAVGGFSLFLAGVALLPNAVVWAAAWLVGPGFAVGTGTSVTPFGVHLQAVPGLPLLAAVPGGPPPRPLALMAPLVPVLAGAIGALVLRRRRSVASWPDVLWLSAGCGAVAGVLLGVLALLSGGPLGADRLARVGPSPWRVGLLAGLEVAVGTGALLAGRRQWGTAAGLQRGRGLLSRLR